MRKTLLLAVLAGSLASAGISSAGVDVGINVRAGLPVPPPVIVAAPPPVPVVVVPKGDHGKHLGHYKCKGKCKKHK